MPPKKGKFASPPPQPRRGRALPPEPEPEPELPPPPLPPPVKVWDCAVRLLTVWSCGLRIVQVAVFLWAVGRHSFPKTTFETLNEVPDYTISDPQRWCEKLTGSDSCTSVPIENVQGRSCVGFGGGDYWKQTFNLSCGAEWCCFGRNVFGYVEGATSKLDAQCADFTLIEGLVTTAHRRQLPEQATGKMIVWLRCRMSDITQVFAVAALLLFPLELIRLLWILGLGRRLGWSATKLDPDTDPVTAVAPEYYATTPLFVVACVFPPVLIDFVVYGTLGGVFTYKAFRLCVAERKYRNAFPAEGLNAWRTGHSSGSWSAHRIIVFLLIELPWAASSVALTLLCWDSASSSGRVWMVVSAAAAVLRALWSGIPVGMCARKVEVEVEEVREPLLVPDEKLGWDSAGGHAAVAAAEVVAAVATVDKRPQKIFEGPASDALPVSRSPSASPTSSPTFSSGGRRWGGGRSTRGAVDLKPGRKNSIDASTFQPL